MKFYRSTLGSQLFLLAVCGSHYSTIAYGDTVEIDGSAGSQSGLYAPVGERIITKDGAGVTVQNLGRPNGNTNGVVELNGGDINLGSGSVINAQGGWGNSNLAGVALAGTNGASSFSADNLSIDSHTDSDHTANTVIGIASLKTGDKNKDSTINLAGLTTINIRAEANSASAYATYGISLDGDGVMLIAQKLKIDVLYDNAAEPSNMGVAGILAVRNGQQMIYNQADIAVTNKTAGSTAYGIQNAASMAGGDTTITMNGGASNQTLVGIDADTLDDATSIELLGNTQINVNAGGERANLAGIFVENKVAQYTQQDGNISIGLDSQGYANATVNGLRVNSLGGNSAINNIDLAVDNLSITNHDDVNDDSHFVYAQQGGNISINAAKLAFIDEATKGIKDAISAENNSNISITSQQTHVDGNIVTDANSTVNFNAGNGLFTGTATNNGGTINLALGNGLTWDMTGNSTVSELSLENSVINFKSDASLGNFYQLKVADLTRGDNATIRMKVDIAAQKGDQLVVTNSSSGRYHLNIANSGSAITHGNEILTVVDSSAATGSTTASFSTNTVEAGGYEYTLQQDGKQQQLRSNGRITHAASASANFLNSSYLLNYVDTQTLLQRMGDLRAANGQEGDVWVRGFAGKLNSFSGSKLHGYGMDYNGVQVGIDKLIPLSRGNLYVGLMAGYTHANPDYDDGTGTVKDTNAGIYGTYIDNSGFYVDTVAKYIRMRNNFNVKDTLGLSIDGNAKSNGYSLSVESGKRFAIDESHFYVEPQLQISYTAMGSATTHASNGLKVSMDSYDSLLGRGSLITGYQVKGGNDPIDVYVKTGYVREFAGDTSYKLNGNKESHDFAGGWFDSAVGINAQFKQRHSVYGELGYAAGGRFDKQQVSVGYRYQF